MLEVRHLDLFYGDAQALDDVSLDVPGGHTVALVGANGAGKTSLIRAVAGMLKPSRGSIRFEGLEIAGQPSHRICDLGIGQVAEGRQIFPSLSVEDNLEMGAVIARGRAGRRRNRDWVMSLFPRLEERRGQAAGTLSGGEQQMLAIGRCLMGVPKLIMFDEPSLGLSPAIVAELFKIIGRLKAENGITVLLVEQNVAVSLGMADHGYVLENGRISLSGSGRELLHDDHVRRAYIGM